MNFFGMFSVSIWGEVGRGSALAPATTAAISALGAAARGSTRPARDGMAVPRQLGLSVIVLVGPFSDADSCRFSGVKSKF